MKTETRVHIISQAEQLQRLIQLAKKGTVCKSDNELVEWFEEKLSTNSYQTYTADYQEIDIDDIPF